ncbi:MAG: DUF72 domain-containing protein [Betaproteobacteria bacterium]
MVHIGTAGWSITRASSAAFPATGTHLQRYSSRLNCVEINSSFYRSHAYETYARWAASTPEQFRFSVKIPKLITHDLRFRRGRIPLERFLDEVAGLGSKLGTLLVQLPPSFEFDARVARTFFSLLRARHEGAVSCEPRHPSWFTRSAMQALVAYRIGRAAADPAVVPLSALPGGWLGNTADGSDTLAYYRWHGSPRQYWSCYAAESLRRLATLITALPATTQTWCVFDNTAAGHALANALELTALSRDILRCSAA